ncbi:MAG: hypothetical protein QM679_12555 [Patulibacter sp.]
MYYDDPYADADEQRRRKPAPAKWAGAAAVCAALAAGAWFFQTQAAGSGHDASDTDAAVIDVSENLRHSIMRKSYAPAVAQFAAEASDAGKQRLCVAVGGRRYLAGPDQCPDITGFGGGPIGAARTREWATNLEQQVDALGGKRNFLAGGSSIFEMVAEVGRQLGRGSRLLVLSDGYQNSPAIGSFTEGKLKFDDAGRAAILKRLKRAELTPDLTGVTVLVPFPFTHGDEPDHQTPARKAAIEQVWREWAQQTGATLKWGAEARRG